MSVVTGHEQKIHFKWNPKPLKVRLRVILVQNMSMLNCDALNWTENYARLLFAAIQ